MLLNIFAYSLVPTMFLITVAVLVRVRILTVIRGSIVSQLLGILLVLSVLFTATTGSILLAQTILA